MRCKHDLKEASKEVLHPEDPVDVFNRSPSALFLESQLCSLLCPRPYLSPFVVEGDDGAEPLDGEGDGGHLVLPAPAGEEYGDQVLLQASLQESVAKSTTLN